MKNVPLTTQTFFSRAIGVAEHYGFCSIDDLQATAPTQRSKRIPLRMHDTSEEQFDHQVLSNVLKDFAEGSELRRRQTLMFYTPSIVSCPGTPHKRVSALTLNAVGTQDPLSEILLIRAAMSVLAELGVTENRVRVNSIGDSDSAARFVKEVGMRLREKQRDLPQPYDTMVRTDIASAIAALYEARHPVTIDLPSPLDFLTAPSRKYFKDILELLEETGLPFDLDDRLYGRNSMYAHTLYEIIDTRTDTPDIVARGGRYDHLTRAYTRSTVPAAGIVIAVQTKNTTQSVGKPQRKKPTACLVHIGREARIRSIDIVERFRREKIPIEQCLQFERFSEQVAYAEAHDSKFVIILGQREVHENVVIVRNASNRSQETIPIDMLPDFLRNHC